MRGTRAPVWRWIVEAVHDDGRIRRIGRYGSYREAERNASAVALTSLDVEWCEIRNQAGELVESVRSPRCSVGADSVKAGERSVP